MGWRIAPSGLGIDLADQERISKDLVRHGLIVRGGFNFDPDEETPPGNNGKQAKSVLLVGNGGGSMWPHFSGWLKRQEPAPENPLDTWSRQIIGEVARKNNARAVFPSDKPYLPFQQWAARAERLRQSPLGILMHTDFGLWHAYRGALLFNFKISIQQPRDVIHHCDGCVGKPCLNSCPVDAFLDIGYDVAKCVTHVRNVDGVRCRERGCIARNACPIATEHRYLAGQQSFHMAAFVKAQTPSRT